MTAGSVRAIADSARAVWRDRWVFSSLDFQLGLAAGVLAAALAYTRDDLVARTGRELAVASMALGAAIVAVALTALAIIAGLMTDVYAKVLQRVRGGIRGVVRPYQAVASVAAIGTAGGGVALIAGELVSHHVLPLGFGLLVGVDVWMLVGTVQLINMTASIGVNRADFYEGIADARRALDERRGKSAPGA